VDHNISSRQRLYARFGMVSHESIVDPIFFPGAFSIPPEGTTDLNFDLRKNKSFALDDTFTFSPSLVASFRYGYTRTFIDVIGDGDSRDPSLLELPEVILKNQTGGGFPIFNLGENVPQIGSRTRLSVNDIHAFFLNMNKLTGNHTFNFGVGDYSPLTIFPSGEDKALGHSGLCWWITFWAAGPSLGRRPTPPEIPSPSRIRTAAGRSRFVTREPAARSSSASAIASMPRVRS